MSEKATPKENPVLSTTATTALTPDDTVQGLRSIRARIPQFVQLPVAESKPLTRAATLSMEFIHAAINAIAAMLGLRSAIGRDAEELRLEAEEVARWSQVLDEIDALRLGVVGAIRVRRYRLGTTALRVYQLSRHLVLDEANASLIPHLDAMKRAAKFGKHRPQRGDAPKPDELPVVQK